MIIVLRPQRYKITSTFYGLIIFTPPCFLTQFNYLCTKRRICLAEFVVITVFSRIFAIAFRRLHRPALPVKIALCLLGDSIVWHFRAILRQKFRRNRRNVGNLLYICTVETHK